MAYIDVGKIENIRFMCHKILPLVYDESLSYYETLCKTANKLNETIDATNQLENNVSDLNGRVTSLNTQVQQIASELNAFESDMQTQFAELEAHVNDTVDTKMREVNFVIEQVNFKISEMDAQMVALKAFVNTSIEQLTKETQELVNNAVAELTEMFNKSQENNRIFIYNTLEKAIKELPEITSIMVINPVSGEMDTIQNALDALFMNTRYFALTCDEYNSLGLSVDDLNTLNACSIPRGYKVFEWLTYARRWLKINREHKAYKPDNGELLDYHKSIEFNTDLFRCCGALTMGEWNDFTMTYAEFAELGMTAEDLAWRSNRLLA